MIDKDFWPTCSTWSQQKAVQINISECFCEMFGCGSDAEIILASYISNSSNFMRFTHTTWITALWNVFFLSASCLFSCHATPRVWCLPLHVSVCCSPTLGLLTEGKTRSPPNVCFWFYHVESWQLQPPPVCHISETEFMTLMSRSLIMNVTYIIYSDLSVRTLE